MSDRYRRNWKIRGATLKEDHYEFLYILESTGLFRIDDQDGSSSILYIREMGSGASRGYINPTIIGRGAIAGFSYNYKGGMKYQNKVPMGKESVVRQLFSRFGVSEENEWGFCAPGGERTEAGEKYVWIRDRKLAEKMFYLRYEVQSTIPGLSGIAFIIATPNTENLPGKLEVTLLRKNP